MKTNTLTHQQNKSHNTKQLLIEKAIDLFIEHGYEVVGVRDIALAADVTTGAFYYYFKSKYDVVNTIYQQNDRYFGELLRHQFQNKLPNDSLTDGILSFFTDHLTTTILQQEKNFSHHYMFQLRFRSTETSNMFQGIAKLVEKAIDLGEIDPSASPIEITQYLFVIFRGVVYEWCVTEKDMDLRREVHKYLQRALRAVKP